jgi:TolB-like protein/class 3 adenylate cyclase/tetratricopeptide (TPR) repeat protein
LAKTGDTERRLVAIFAADVEGYSRLMGADEVGTLRDLTRRRTILDGLIASHRGRIANTAGDSVLAEFGSAVDAVQCAVEAQAALSEANAGLSPDRHINFRIGVHVGDIMVKGGDLFGDSVNIAARLQTLASAGGVCVSGVAHDQVRKILPFAFSDLGAQQVKNIDEPVRAFALVTERAAVVTAPAKASAPLALPDKPSIAVLPFTNMSGDPEQEYFADGMVEDITTALSRIKWLFVIARNSSFTFKGRAVNIKQVGRELGVRYVLEGSVRKAGNRVRITGQLIDAAIGTHLWADRFDGELDDIFALQDKVTEAVVSAISPKLEQVEFERANRKPTANLTAYDYYLRGSSVISQGSSEVLADALVLFKKAIELDPKFALAYAAAAAWHTVWIVSGQSVDRESEIAAATEFAKKAIALDSDDALVLGRAGWALAFVAGELDGGADFLRRATEADPNSAYAWTFRGMSSVLLGRHEEAIEYLKRALRLSPLDPLIFARQIGLAMANFQCGRHEEALQWGLTSLHHNPTWMGSRRFIIAFYALSGRIDDAKAAWKALRKVDPTMRISNIRIRFPLRRDEDFARLAEGYRLAGVPE